MSTSHFLGTWRFWLINLITAVVLIAVWLVWGMPLVVAEQAPMTPPQLFGASGTYGPPDLMATDVAVDQNGFVYVVEWMSSSVLKYTPDKQLMFSNEQPGLSIRRIAVDQQGRIYVTSKVGILVFSNTGELENVWEIGKSGEGGIKALPDGRIMVSRAANTQTNPGEARVEFYDHNGILLEVFGMGQFISVLDAAVTPDGGLLVLDRSAAQVIKFDSEGNLAWKIGRLGSEPGEFRGPVAISVDSEGSFFVSDRKNYRVQKFDSTGVLLTEWGSKGTEPGQFLQHNGLFVATDDTVWVAGYHGNNIQRFDNNGELIEEWKGYVSSEGEFSQVRGITVAGEKLFAVDLWNNKIQVFDAFTGEFLYKFGERGGGDAAAFNFPRTITKGPDGHLYISDDQRVVRVTQDGEFVQRYESVSPGRIGGALGLAVTSSGILFQADTGLHRIVKRDVETGETLLVWGTKGAEPGQFSYPSGIAVASDGTVYVADRNNKRIQTFTEQGQFIAEWPTMVPDGGEIVPPLGLSIDADSGFLLVGSRGLVVAYDTEGVPIYSFNVPGQEEGHTHVTVSDRGMVYATNNLGTVYSFYYPPDIEELPSFKPGRDSGLYLWKDSGGRIQLRMSGDGLTNCHYSLKAIATGTIIVGQIKLEEADSLDVTEFSFSLEGTVKQGNDGLELYFDPNDAILLYVDQDGMPNPGILHLGRSGTPIPPSGWIISQQDIGIRPQFTPGVDRGLFIGWAELGEQLEARWSGDGTHRDTEFVVLSSLGIQEGAWKNLESGSNGDMLIYRNNAVFVDGSISNDWDGVDIEFHLQPNALVGLNYREEGQIDDSLVNSSGLGLPNAYWLPTEP